MLTAAAEQLLSNYPAGYRDIAIKAVKEGKAFCPACHFAGHSNCAHFDECGSFVEPTGDRAR